MAVWKTPPYNSVYMNWKRGIYCAGTALFLTEPVKHFHSCMSVMSQFYEWPKTRSEYNIFFKETMRVPDFWKELTKKLMFGMVAAGGDTAVKLASWQYIYGGTSSP